MPSLEVRKERILETACKQFMSHGFRRVSMDEIAKGAGVGKGTVYQLFSSKEELMLNVIDFFSVQVETSVEALLADENYSPIEKLRQFLFVIKSRLSILRSDSLSELEIDFPEAYQKIQQKRQQIIFGNLTTLLHEGKQSGIYDSQVDEELAAHVVIGAIDHVSKPEVLSTFNCLPDQLFQSILLIILNGCLTPEYREKLQSNPTGGKPLGN